MVILNLECLPGTHGALGFSPALLQAPSPTVNAEARGSALKFKSSSATERTRFSKNEHPSPPPQETYLKSTNSLAWS